MYWANVVCWLVCVLGRVSFYISTKCSTLQELALMMYAKVNLGVAVTQMSFIGHGFSILLDWESMLQLVFAAFLFAALSLSVVFVFWVSC